MPVLRAIRGILAGESEITSRLGSFDFGDGTQRPAIWTSEEVDVKCPNPMITMSADGGDDEEMGDGRIERLVVTLAVWGDNEWTDKELRELSDLVRAALKPQRLTLEGADDVSAAWIVGRSLPTRTKDEKGFPGDQMGVEVEMIRADG